MSAVSGSETQRALVLPGRTPLAVPRRILRLRSDAALAERFAAGDEAAFDVLYERHRPVVLAVAMGVLGTIQDAEDATQETFSALAVALHNKPPTELRPWLIRVARNASIDTTRRRRHRLLTLDGELPDVPARSASAGRAELAVVLDGIRELPEGQRIALLMRELGGHSYSEIAQFLETEEEAVKGLIARARVGLRTYREATDLPCATARAAIASEPDGRRHDKTIRRHMRSCASCRSYRGALRDDAKALRAALPLPAGSVATGGMSTGMLTAAKGTLIGYGLTQAATTCAAAACGVGAIGGMVFVTPIHKLGPPPIVAAAKVAPARNHPPVKTAARKPHTAVLPVHQSTPAFTPAVTPAIASAVTPSATSSKPAVAHMPAVERSTHFQPPTTNVTRLRQPSHTHGTGSAPTRWAGTHVPPPQASDGTPGTIVPSAGNSGNGPAYGYGHQHQSPSTAPGYVGPPTQSATPTSGDGQSGSGPSNSDSHGQGNHYGNQSSGVMHGGGPGVAGTDNAQPTSAGQSGAGVSTWAASGSADAGSAGVTRTGGHGHGRSWGDQSAAAGRAGQDSSGQGYSGQGYSGQGYSGQGYSGQGYSGQGYSGHGYPSHGYSDQGYSGHGYSDQGYSDQGYSSHGYSSHGNPGHGGSSHGHGWGH